jgi:hypothetical protein
LPKPNGLAAIKAIRSSSEFNFSMITLIFEGDVDFYFARQRVTEKLGQANAYLPPGVVPYLAPDATVLSFGTPWRQAPPTLWTQDARKDFMGCFELAFYGWREGAARFRFR